MPHDAGVVSRKIGVASRCAEVARNKVARCSFSVSRERFLDAEDEKTCLALAGAGSVRFKPPAYFFFCCAFIFAHLVRCAAAIFLRPAADIVRLAGAVLVVVLVSP
jgi:hypothetical protein